MQHACMLRIKVTSDFLETAGSVKLKNSLQMNVVILSNLPLEEIEEVARKEFSTIANKNVTKPTFFSNPYPAGTKFVCFVIIFPIYSRVIAV